MRVESIHLKLLMYHLFMVIIKMILAEVLFLKICFNDRFAAGII